MEFHRCDFEGMPVQVQEFMQLVQGLPAGDDGRRWQERANCLGVDPDLFFPERGASTREAKAVCRGCEVRGECLEYALDHGEKFGIWGGLSERERRRVRRQRALERRRLASA
jgi:WhiB family redox-sensing transcriptional regulator